jgi:hypothetical protein
MGDEGSHTWCSHPVGDDVEEAEYVRADLVQADHIADERNMGAGEVQADSCARLVAFHAAQLDSNPYCYFELAYTRQTDWMAWITDRPAQGEPGTAAYAKSRKVIVRGQGPTAQEACADALAALAARDRPH